ncbi:MAG: S41 family peptidase [Bacteroidales bacterium]|nr:S41 family peptidase [Bacteroidales bacterium]
MKKIYVTLIFVMVLSGCEKLFFEEDIRNNVQNNFMVFWNDFDRYYPFFEIKNIDWDSVYDHYSPMITDQTTELQLFQIFSEMIKPLNDGHVAVISRFGTAQSYQQMEILDSYYYYMSLYDTKYFEAFSYNDNNINYYNLINYNIGYFHINSFNLNDGGLIPMSSSSYLIVDEILQKFKDKDGVIIDIRWNAGGLIPNSETIASRFTDQKRLYAKLRSKNGPAENDFSDWTDYYFEPQGAYQFTKPVAVLTSRLTGSASEWFILAMKTLPNVTVVGDTTNGSFSYSLMRELPNGWSFSLSTEIVATPDMKIYEGVGIPPDVVIVNSQNDFDNRNDIMLMKAIDILEN